MLRYFSKHLLQLHDYKDRFLLRILPPHFSLLFFISSLHLLLFNFPLIWSPFHSPLLCFLLFLMARGRFICWIFVLMECIGDCCDCFLGLLLFPQNRREGRCLERLLLSVSQDYSAEQLKNTLKWVNNNICHYTTSAFVQYATKVMKSWGQPRKNNLKACYVLHGDYMVAKSVGGLGLALHEWCLL